jgi:hypothetical protein
MRKRKERDGGGEERGERGEREGRKGISDNKRRENQMEGSER